VTYYLTVDDAIATHARLIARFGGSLGAVTVTGAFLKVKGYSLESSMT